MPSLSRETASERVVLLLRPKEKRTLERLARKEKISAGELLRRSLSMYAELDAIAKSGKLAQAEAALDRTMASIQSARNGIATTLKNIEEQQRNPAYAVAQERLEEIVRHASASANKRPTSRRVAA